MADFVQTLSNSLSVIGPGGSVNWGFFNWGENVWFGPSTEFETDVGKSLSNSVSLSETTTNRVLHYLSNAATLTDLFNQDVAKKLTNSMILTDAFMPTLSLTISNSLTLTDLTKKKVNKQIDNSPTFTSSSSKDQSTLIIQMLNLVAIGDETHSEVLMDSTGIWSYYFAGETPNADLRVFTEWTQL